MAEWKEGQLFPKGWGDMNAFQKVSKLQLYCSRCVALCPSALRVYQPLAHTALGLGTTLTWVRICRVTSGLLSNLALHAQVAELYTGKRGLLFWMGKLTYALIFIVIGGWIVFRFVLPGLGVLELQNGLDSRPNY